MPKSIRPWVTAGIAVVGTGVIAVAPFEPLPPGNTIRITNSAVELNATPSPIDYYPQVVMRSLDNAGDRLGEYLAAPFPIVTAALESQYDAIADIADATDDDNLVAVVNAIIRAIATPVANLAKVAASGQPFEMAASLIVRLALPVVSGVIAAASTTGDVIESLLDFDVVGAFSAVTNLPARIIDGFLNGRVDAVSDEYFGLLAPVAETPVTDQLTGPVAFLIESLQDIGETIASPSPVGIDADPAVQVAGAATVTAPVESPAAPGTEKSGSDRSDDPPATPAEEPQQSAPDAEPPSVPAESAPGEAVASDPPESGDTPRMGTEESAAPASGETPSEDTDTGEGNSADSSDTDGSDASTSPTSTRE